MNENAKNERREAALLDAVRLGLNGDTRSLRQRARNMLRTGREPLLSTDGRRYLQDLLAGDESLSSLRSDANTELAPAVPPPGEAVPTPDSQTDARRPILADPAEERVESLIREYENRHLLEEANLAPTTRVLLAGPPGGGKTMTARYIAHRLDLPLMLAEPSRVLTGVMGQSARNLSALMHQAGERPCVLFLDELDAYARRRSDAQDIAEPKRLVNTLLLELDRWPPRALILGATNHPGVIDEAVRRRFEMTIELGLPTRRARREIIEDVLARAGREASPALLAVLANATDKQSGSELVDQTVSAIRRSIIEGVPVDDSLGQRFLSGRFKGRTKAASSARQLAAAELATEGWDTESIARVLDMQGRTVTDMLDRSE